MQGQWLEQLTRYLMCLATGRRWCFVAVWLVATVLLVTDATGSTYTRQDNATSLDQAGAWSGGPPGSGDIAQWNGTCATAANCTNGAAANVNLNWGGIQNTGGNPGTNVVIPASGTSTLTLNASGIDWNYASATRNLTIACPLVLGTAQNWTVGGGRTVTVSSNVDMSAGYLLTVNGTNAVTLSGAISGSGGILVSNATTTTLTLSGNNSSWSGDLTIVTGKVVVTTSANALGTTNGITTVVGTGAQLDIQTTNVGENVTINGTGISSGGALVNSATTAGILTGTVTLASSASLGGGGTGGLVLDGKVTGAYTFTKVGSGALTLNNSANDFAGPTVVNAGVLRLGAANALGASPGNLTATGGVVEGTASYASFTQTLGAAAGQLQIPGGTSGFSANGAVVMVNLTTNGGTAGCEVQWGSTYFKPTTLVLNETTANNGLIFQNPLDLNATTRTINVNANTATVASLIRTATGTAGLTKGGSGTLRLVATNTYNGVTTINNGIVEVTKLANVGVASSLGAPALAQSTNAIGTVATGAGLRFIGDGDQSTDRAINMAGTTGGVTLDSSGAGTITFAGNIVAGGAGSKTLTLDGTSTGTISGVIADNSLANLTAVTKTGPGTWVLSGTNTYTGVTTVRAGTLTFGKDALNTNAFLNVEGGMVNLDFAGTNTIIGLILGGSRAANGLTYGAAGSGADVTSPYLAGSGKVLQAGTVRYVDCAASSAGDGLSWSTAYQNLSNALANASDGLMYWVAQGTYTNGSITIAKPYVAIYGGFTNGMTLLSQRNWTNFPTIVDGTNGCRCINNSAGYMVLDGFTVRNGAVNGPGAGLYYSATVGSLVAQNCQFSNNVINQASGSTQHGGAVYSRAPFNTFVNCLFYSNRVGTVAFRGGAVHLETGTHLFSSCVFSNNVSTDYGGALCSYGDVTISNCEFTANTGGNTYRGSGAITLVNTPGTSTVVNSRFVGNSTTTYGGAVNIAQGNTSYRPVIVFRDCAFAANTAGNGGAISQGDQLPNRPTYNSLVQCVNCVFSNNTGRALYAATGEIALWGCDLIGNSAGALKSSGNTWVSNCAVIANSAASGGGFSFDGASTNVFVNCTFLTNSATGGQGGAILSTHASAMLAVTNCIFWQNRSTGTGTNIQNAGTLNLAYCDIATNGNWVAGGTLNYGAGIINTDPLFASAVAPHDVHLQSEAGRYSNGMWVVDAQTSPCIDAGDTNSPYSNELPLNGGRINLGRYGNTAEASKSYMSIMGVLGTNGSGIAVGAAASSAEGTDYGTNTVGVWTDHTFTITNSGTKALTLLGTPAIAITGNTADFITNGTVATTVLAGGQTTFTIRFNPQSLGAKAAVVSITNSDTSHTPYTFSLSGYGFQSGAADMDVLGTNGTIITAGAVASASQGTHWGLVVTNTWVDHVFTVTNAGSAVLVLTGATAVAIGGDTADFVTNGPTVATNIAAGDRSTFQVRFMPTAIGVRTALVTVVNNALGKDPYTFALRGTGDSGAEMDVLGTNGLSIDVGEAASAAKGTDWGVLTVGGGEVDRVFTITNRGAAALTLSGSPRVAIGGDANFTLSGDAGTSLLPGGATNFTVQFTPSALGLYTALVSIANNDIDENPYTFDLSAVVDVSPVAGVIYVNGAATLTPEDGTTWQRAYRTMTKALTSATGVFWVAQGTYGTDPGGSGMEIRTNTIYGGFAGTETALGQRNWTDYPTILDGSGLYRVLQKATAGLATVDGFIVRNGRTSGNGAGINCTAGSLLVRNCRFLADTNTAAGSLGGAVHSTAQANTFSNCCFSSNASSNSTGQAGALFLGAGSNLLSGCVFSNNLAGGEGGALRCDGNLMASDCDFVDNTGGGNKYRGGGAFILSQAGVTNTFVNCRFVGNKDMPNGAGGGFASGGAIDVCTTDSTRPPLLVFQSCEFRDNISCMVGPSSGHGGAISLMAQNNPAVYATVQCSDCVFSNNSGKAALYATTGQGVFGLTRCTFIGNTRALYSLCDSWATNCSFVANSSVNGGGLYFAGPTTNVFVSCTFLTNSATGGQGGAILSTNADAVLSVANCIFWNNRSTGTGTNIQNGGTLNLAYCNINTNANWVAGGTINYGAGIIDVDPLFASAVPPYDVHLRSAGGRWNGTDWVRDAETSPLIDAGDPSADYSSEPHPSYGVEMGSYGNTPYASRTLPKGTIFVFR